MASSRSRPVPSAFRAFVVTALLLSPTTLNADDALRVGSAAPRFQLPLVNQFENLRSFGPARWVGEKAPTKKLVIMSFFASWCEPCKKEMPVLARLYQTYGEQGLGVVLVSIDKGLDKREDLLALTSQSGVTFPVVHDRFSFVARRYSQAESMPLPYMVQIDAAGNVVQIHEGYDDAFAVELEREIRVALGLPAKEITKNDAADGKGRKGKRKRR